MRLNEIAYTDAKPVEGYGPGFFRVGGEVFQGALIVGPKGTMPWGGVRGCERSSGPCRGHRRTFRGDGG